MDYNHITTFLEKFKKILSQGEMANAVIAETISKHISYPIALANIKTKGTVIYVKCSPLVRSELLMHKQAILSELQNKLTDRNFSDLR